MATIKRPVPAALADPFYYLANARILVDWVRDHHGDLLLDEEKSQLTAWLGAGREARALLVRMVMRQGEHFRLSRLRYGEIGDPAPAGGELVSLGLVYDGAAIPVEELSRLLSLIELNHCFAGAFAGAGLARATKGVKRDWLCSRPEYATPRPFADWWPASHDRLLSLACMPLFERLRLMFFGNLHQDWSEFVLTELGNQRYETVPFTPESRAFHHRAEVDHYLALYHLRRRLEEGEAPATLLETLPAPLDNDWLAARRAKLMYQLARAAEKAGDGDTALRAYRHSGDHQARVRQARLLERRGDHGDAFALAQAGLAWPRDEAELQGMARLYRRLYKKVGAPAPAPVTEAATLARTLTLPASEERVELAAAKALAGPDAPVYYVENHLFNGLLALLCWEALYAPLPGAFFHPFHAGPADLFRPGFAERRQDLLAACLARLEDGSYRTAILARYRQKQGISCPLLAWPALSEPLLERALGCIPPAHLSAIFTRLLSDLRGHGSGLPDLIRFLPDGDYELVEVKGPGDRLQDNQRRWLAFFHRQSIAASVCQVRWLP
ncbi:VRR-NUC domain-containing protein [Zobellella sp. DQSA1]|uniref:VRR-NUC domain-containing protein n=1 Tax=Zobellella sp. DQSA1 TaxID=3342386 RepID=UPI0035C0F768